MISGKAAAGGAGGVVGGGGGKLGAAAAGLAAGAYLASSLSDYGVTAIERDKAETGAGSAQLRLVRASGVGNLDTVRETVADQRERVERMGETQFGDVMKLFGASDIDVERKTNENILKEMETHLTSLEKAAASMDSAAKSLDSMSPATTPTVNRGERRGPVKQ